MAIHLIVGYQGSGKTLYMVKKAHEYYKAGKKIYSNIHFVGIKYEKIYKKDIIDCKYRNAVVFIDEIHLLLPSRNSMSKDSREICDGFLSMIRKAGLEVFGSTQTKRKVDIRFREETDYLYNATKYAYINYKWELVQHSENLNTDIPIMIKIEVMEMINGNMININFYGNPFFKLFDTKQIIKIK